jgi:hypothetical protein
MNGFLNYLLSSIVEEESIIKELLIIDNEIQTTNLNVEQISKFLYENMNTDKLLTANLKAEAVILTEGDPFLIIKILNDLHYHIDILFINRYFVGINKWLTKKCMDYFDKSFCLDVEESYSHYLTSNDDIVIIGSNEFVAGTQNDFTRELLKFEEE